MALEERAPRAVGTLWILDPNDSLPVIAPRVQAIFRRLGPEAMPALSAALGEGLLAEFLRRFESGRRCYAAWVGEELAAYGWVSFGEEDVGELGLRVNLLDCEAYIWDCVTLPAFRQKGLFAALLGAVANALRTEGVCSIWIGANKDNAPSQRGIDRAGFRRVVDLLVARVDGQMEGWLEGYPGVSNELVAEARRVLLDNHERVRLNMAPG